jgi:hypothetical protein
LISGSVGSEFFFLFFLPFDVDVGSVVVLLVEVGLLFFFFVDVLGAVSELVIVNDTSGSTRRPCRVLLPVLVLGEVPAYVRPLLAALDADEDVEVLERLAAPM